MNYVVYPLTLKPPLEEARGQHSFQNLTEQSTTSYLAKRQILKCENLIDFCLKKLLFKVVGATIIETLEAQGFYIMVNKRIH